MVRVALVLIVAGIAGMVFGGHKLMVAMRNSSPVQMKYADWRNNPPDAEWLELSEVHIDWGASARIDVEHKRKGVTTHTTHDYYVACWASEEDPNPVRAFLKVEDKSKQNLMEECWNHENDQAWIVANANRIYEVQTVRGLVQTGLDLSSEDQRLLKGLGHVDNDFKIIELNKEPEGGFGAFLFVLGLAGTGVAEPAWPTEEELVASVTRLHLLIIGKRYFVCESPCKMDVKLLGLKNVIVSTAAEAPLGEDSWLRRLSAATRVTSRVKQNGFWRVTILSEGKVAIAIEGDIEFEVYCKE